jgi:hypothetical protein
MGIFKYLSDILSKFSRTQRIFALSMLLMAAVVLYLGKPIIDALSTDCDELTIRIEIAEKRIRSLQTELDSSETTIIKNQRACTNDITQREQEFRMMLDDLSREVKRHKKIQTVPQRNLEMAIIDPNDSSVVSAMVRPEPKKIKIEDFSWIDSKIEDYKRKLSSK